MANVFSCVLELMILILITTLNVEASRKAYIVYMGAVSDTDLAHSELVRRVLEDSNGAPEDYLLHSYRKSFNGFAAMLTEIEAYKLSGMEGVVSVFLSRKYRVQTTRSWNFLGLPSTSKRQFEVESNLIVGVIDTGIWPESDSFKSNNLSPPPAKWRGSCQNITCNNKIIGAKYFYSGNKTIPGGITSIDTAGHGTHVAATIAGVEVNNASYFGIANGTARGGAPSVRIASYKVCWTSNCNAHDILAAFSEAIHDGVDIISISLGDYSARDYFNDTISIGSFHAMQAGILTVTAAGNWGPGTSSVVNVSPWLLTVTASHTDRRIKNMIELGNGKIFIGNSINSQPTQHAFYPLEWNEKFSKNNIMYKNYTLVPRNLTVKGAIFYDYDCIDFSTLLRIPSSCFTKENGGRKILHYKNTARNPAAKIFRSKAIFYNSSSPTNVLSFASRGPNPVTPDILKPDISAPGVEILAAWTPKSTLYSPGSSNSSVFKFSTGTSMACPHVTGAALYVKSFHPSWSPAAIKSAIMTTALPMSKENHPEAEFAYGAGLLNPLAAVDPGLIYDATERDYIQFLCSQGYDFEKIKNVTGKYEVCQPSRKMTVRDLNQPTMTVQVNSQMPFKVKFIRKAINVGMENSSYVAHISCPNHLNIVVKPNVLSFKLLNEMKMYRVTVSGAPLRDIPMASASLTWSDGKYSVRSPIVVYVGKK